MGFGNATIGKGESYCSNDGVTWVDLYNENNIMNLCIKAYTQEEEKRIEIGDIRGQVKKGKNGVIGLPISTTYEAKGKTVQISILKNGVDVTKNFTISGNTIRGNGAYVTIGYPNNVQDGEYTIKVTVPGVGTQTKNIIFIGEKYDISKCTITGLEDKIYTGNEITQNIQIKNEVRTLEEGIDYDIIYENNINPGKATVIITGKGNFKGTIIKYFNITKIDISKYTISGIKNKEYTGNNITQNISVINGNTILKNGIDYTLSYSNNKNPGKAIITITGKGIYQGTIKKTFIIIPKKVNNFKVKEQTTDKITLNWSKAIGVKGYKIYSYNYSKKKWECVGNTTNASYTVKKLKAGTTYKYKVRDYITVDSTEYFGSYTSDIKTTTKTKTPNISKLTTKNKKATIKWKKVSGASGYEVYMATSKKGKYSKIKNVTKSSTTNYTKSKLKKNKKYYFKIRAYRTIDGKKIYSSYSSIKYIKIK